MNEGDEFMKPAHRDDVPMDVVEKIEDYMADKFPGYQVLFAGDQPGELPPEIADQMAAVEARHRRSFMEGLCLDCDKKMENWPPPEDEEDSEGWKLDEGWVYFTQGEQIIAFQCPECDAKEKEENDGSGFSLHPMSETDEMPTAEYCKLLKEQGVQPIESQEMYEQAKAHLESLMVLKPDEARSLLIEVLSTLIEEYESKM